MKRLHKISTAAILLALGISSAAHVAPASADNYFSQTGKTVWGTFEQYWLQHGGLAQFGMPRTNVYPTGEGYDAQWFERALFTYNPKNPDPYKVQLQLLGAIVTDNRRAETAFKPATQQPGTSFFRETQHNLSGKLLEYWRTTGGVQVYGYPISEPFVEVNKSDGKPYTVQYFERNRLELHPELTGTRFEVQLGLLGSELLDRAGGPAVFESRGKPEYYQPAVPGPSVPPGDIVEPPESGPPPVPPTPIPAAPALPAATRPVVYEDNFQSQNLSNWQPLAAFALPDAGVPKWRVRDGLLEQLGDAASESTADDAFLVLNQPAAGLTDFTLDTYFRSVSGEGIGAAFRMNGDNFYLVRLYGANPDGQVKADLMLVNNGERKVIASAGSWPGYTPNQWQRLTIRTDGTAITVLVNDAKLFAVKDTTLSVGKVSLYARASGVAKFDNFRITAP